MEENERRFRGTRSGTFCLLVRAEFKLVKAMWLWLNVAACNELGESVAGYDGSICTRFVWIFKAELAR